MNLNIATGSRGLYYSSVKGEEENKGFTLSPMAKPMTSKSPTNRNESKLKNRPSSIPRAVTTSIHSASKRMKNTARTLTPKRFLLSPCLSHKSTNKAGRRLGNDSYQDDDITPVIFYADEDAAARRTIANEISFLDPFAFEATQDPPQEEPKKETTKVHSPTSVMGMGLFTVEEESSVFANGSESEEEDAVFFDDPFFPRSLTRVFDENTSIDLSEGIKSINAASVSDGVMAAEQGQAVEDESPEQWFGFFNAESFISYEWDPELEDKSFE
ncbi:hypothetical protein HJC23_009422 [Cyclotella cryptica]|uniref:Uncharacterized protein n=1 Tax=Cyclotella cryptica TaxID=29204 RepID=A0ABD3PYB7_9STRA|eukprot:CCRYP_010601-RA/>CCRYP_010601-RA protein AED:0.02 eAED:-0.02 QI:0/-1/0/1/-1/1/1/0/270